VQVQPPPGANGQNQQPQYAPYLAPVMPLMMPYGMMPYPGPPMPMPAGHPQAFPHMQPHAGAPTGQQQPQRRNNGFAGTLKYACSRVCFSLHHAMLVRVCRILTSHHTRNAIPCSRLGMPHIRLSSHAIACEQTASQSAYTLQLGDVCCILVSRTATVRRYS